MFATLEAKVLGSVALVAILLGAFGVYTFHERAVGKATELAALQKSSAELQKQTAAQTADLKARATMAEQSYDKEHAALSNLPPVQPVRLCLNANRSAVVPGSTPKVAGDAATSPAAGGVQPVPAGDSTGPDIGPILSALAARADQISATLREFQSR
jgi:hypothetical protein